MVIGTIIVYLVSKWKLQENDNDKTVKDRGRAVVELRACASKLIKHITKTEP